MSDTEAPQRQAIVEIFEVNRMDGVKKNPADEADRVVVKIGAGCVVLLVLVVALFFYLDARGTAAAYNRVTGSNISAWDAFILGDKLRVNERTEGK